MKKHKKLQLEILLALALAVQASPVAMALPQGGVIAGGSGSISSSGTNMNITQETKNLFINWDAFSIAKGEKVHFAGPESFSVLNRVVGHDASKIYGELSASNNGNVYLINPNGILIGDGAVINTGSFVASTKDVIDVTGFMNTGKPTFQGEAQGNIVNLGAIKANHIEMHGDTISLKAAQVESNFDAPSVVITANAVHAGVYEGETTAAVDAKLGVTSEAFRLMNSMSELREAVQEDSHGKYMLAGDDLTEESWTGDAPDLNSGAAIDGLGYTVANKKISEGFDGTGIFHYISQHVSVDNFTFDNITVIGNSTSQKTGTGTLAGYLDDDGVRIANVTVSNGSVTGYNHVGGLIGWSQRLMDGNTFLNVHNVNTSITGISLENEETGIGVGGIIGYERGWSIPEGVNNVFRNVSNSGHITGRMYVGGIAGRLVTADMDQVRNTGRIEQDPFGTLKSYTWNGQVRYYMSYQNTECIGGIVGAIGPEDEAAQGVRITNAYNSGSYPDGGYVWKMYETGAVDSNGNKLYYKPELTAFLTKVETQKASVEHDATDVSGALYDVTMPDGQQIKGVTWEQVLELQQQFTRVNNRGNAGAEADFTASNSEAGGTLPDNLYGFYNSSTHGLNIFITPETVKPEPPEPVKPDLPEREISRNDYLYSDDATIGGGEIHWYMHLAPEIYVQDSGVRMDKKDEKLDKD